MPALRASTTPSKVLDIETLADGIGAILEDTVGYYRYHCMVSFNENGHRSGVQLDVDYDGSNHEFIVIWRGEITDEILRAHGRDLVKAAEIGAVAIALLLVREITPYNTVESSAIGTTVDYYLTDKINDSDLIFNHTSRLEVSGIITENASNTVKGRVNRKISRLKPERNLPAIICVVEFGEPCAQMVTT